MYLCISPETIIVFITSFLYALNPQLKSCNLIPENNLVTQLKILVGIVLEIGSLRFFFHPETKSKMDQIDLIQSKLDLDKVYNQTLKNIEKHTIKYEGNLI